MNESITIFSSEQRVLPELASFFRAKRQDIESWIAAQWQMIQPPVYCSVDIRNAGYKLAAVDTNLFPAGYNNLPLAQLPLYAETVRRAVLRRCPQTRKILLIPENHTRNLFYLENVVRLIEIFSAAGFMIRVGSVSADVLVPTDIALPNGQSLRLFPVRREHNRLFVDDFVPDVILSNNDWSSGLPPILTGLDEQIHLIPLRAGWWSRRKSHHFRQYDIVTAHFAEALEFDPWFINPFFNVCEEVNFQKHQGVPCLSELVDDILTKIRGKYAQYGIEEAPFVILKADAGTYGMGIMSVKDASEVTNLNRKQRNKMSVVKEGLPVESVLIQEGVYTIDSVDGVTAESVIYLFDDQVVGGFYRVNDIRGRSENLNAAGMRFVPFEHDIHTMSDSMYASSVIGRLAALAAARELVNMEVL